MVSNRGQCATYVVCNEFSMGVRTMAADFRRILFSVHFNEASFSQEREYRPSVIFGGS